VKALVVCALIIAAVVASESPGAAGPPACLASGLGARGVFQGATGATEGGVYVRNRSAHLCILSGRPLVDLLAGRERLDVRTVAGTTTIGRRVARMITLAPGRRAFVRLRWTNWCGARYRTVGLRLWIQTVQPRLPVHGAVVPPRCDAPAAPSTLAVGPFERLR
jgi:hypothetical protein